MKNYNDGSTNPPRLRIDHSMWAMSRLPMNSPREWTLREKFTKAKNAGFEAVMCRLSDDNEYEISTALRESEMRLVMVHSTADLEVVKDAAKRGVRCGADFLFLQPGKAFTPLEEIAHTIIEGRKISNDAGLPYFVEIHRNYYTENLPQCLKLIEKIPDIRLTADLSHLILVGEFYGWPEERAIERLAPILERTAHIHARVSDGECIQVDVGDGSGQTAQFFVELWAQAMRHWLKDAQPGDVFPFASELGPPKYAITLPNGDEVSDRWQQSLVMKKLGEQAWQKAQAP